MNVRQQQNDTLVTLWNVSVMKFIFLEIRFRRTFWELGEIEFTEQNCNRQLRILYDEF